MLEATYARGPSSSGPDPRLVFLTDLAVQSLHLALGLSDAELERICDLLERSPNDFELAVFSLLWSEHCAYKHSAIALRRLPSAGAHVLQGPGENAGVIDVGEGQAVAFKVESHNHPSAVEPFQGAATGVGGILRDIVAMGARPVALLDGLRFGEPGWELTRAVGGVGHYGNSVGVPTVGGECVFDPAYRFNPLVNAMCVGLLPVDRVLRARATAQGATIVLFGATTGRDGIGGASVLASRELGETDDDLRPTVQVGDPFTGKKLIEASCELVERGLVDALQDLGAAGLASALAELAGDGTGIDIELERVPLREAGLEPWEIMISESQERMLAVVEPGRIAEVEAVCRGLDLASATIGEVTGTGRLRCFHGGELAGDIPTNLLTDKAPRYRLEPVARPLASPAARPAALRASEALLVLLRSPNIASKAWVFRQYDHLVGSRTVRRPSLDAAVLRLRPSLRGLALSLDGCGRLCSLDPRTGGAAVVVEAARNVACAGGRPLAVTDCLNFGNPEKPEIAWELLETIEGMALACEALGLPVVSGNVSLYNETDGTPIHPTPVVGCVGLVEDVRTVPAGWREGDVVLLAGAPTLAFDGSEYQAVFGEPGGRPPSLDLEAEASLVDFLWQTAPLLTLAHDVSLGGLGACLAQAAAVSGVGAHLELPDDPLALFGEGGGQVVLACAPDEVDFISARAGIELRRLGVVGGDRICGVVLDEVRRAWERV